MQTVDLMISKTPNHPSTDQKHLAECIDLCAGCELACVACADACLGEKELSMLRKCIRANQDCADVCGVTGRLLSRQFEPEPEVLVAQLEACARACVASAAECHRHGDVYAHCGICADACDRCEASCREVLKEFSLVRA